MKNLILLISILLFSSVVHAENPCPVGNPTYFCLPPEAAPNSEIQAVDFYTIPMKIISLFQKELASTGYPLKLDAKWESPFFGAGVTLYENQFTIMILGGMTRIDEMTKDAYAAIVCHELGHILGGAPHQTIPSAEWSSAEGQSDFFAASVCLPRYFKSLNIKQEALASQIEVAGFEMVTALSYFDREQKLIRHLEYKKKVTATLINAYPDHQCRYETFRAPNTRAACWYK